MCDQYPPAVINSYQRNNKREGNCGNISCENKEKIEYTEKACSRSWGATTVTTVHMNRTTMHEISSLLLRFTASVASCLAAAVGSLIFFTKSTASWFSITYKKNQKEGACEKLAKAKSLLECNCKCSSIINLCNVVLEPELPWDILESSIFLHVNSQITSKAGRNKIKSTRACTFLKHI